VIDEIRKAVISSIEKLGYYYQHDEKEEEDDKAKDVKGSQEFDISEPARKEYGDLACNVAFQISKKLKKRPFEIANEVVEKQLRPYISEKKNKHKEDSSFILSAEAHPTGYINFRINFEKLATSTLNAVLDNPNFGFLDIGKNKHALIEHTSVNPNKALHIGHLRNMVIGDTLYRIMKATNYKTFVLNYIDDSGLQVADIVVGFKFAGFAVDPSERSNRSTIGNDSNKHAEENNKNSDVGNKINFEKFDHYSDEVYVKVNELYQTDKALQEKRQVVLKEIEKGTSEIAHFSSKITMRVLKDQLKTAWRMKSHYDLLNFESQIIHSKLWSRCFELLKQNGIAHFETTGKNKGCWVIKVQGEEDKVITRSDGTTTYIAKDIPYASWKLGLVEDPFYYYKFAVQWDDSPLWATTLDAQRGPDNNNKNHLNPRFSPADIAITITDVRQDRLQRIISKVLLQMQSDAREYHHLGYESVSLSSETAKLLGLDIGDKKFLHMSGRKGINIDADYVLEELRTKAHQEVKKRNPDLSIPLQQEIAEEIAVSALRYSLIKQDLGKMITFDIAESLNLEGDTGPYLQYAYARSQHILQKSDQDYSQRTFESLSFPEEHDLITEISKFDIVVEESARNFNPKLIAKYAYTLATEFNLFYEKVHVLREKDLQVMHARLVLVHAFGLILRKAMGLLAITPLEKM
jgi:arginyl-tRNA synthetase